MEMIPGDMLPVSLKIIKRNNMCLAVPGKVISIDDSNPDLRMARVDFSGIIREVCIQWLPETKTGDYILAHVGMALNILDEDEARETLDLLRELGEMEINQQSFINGEIDPDSV